MWGALIVLFAMTATAFVLRQGMQDGTKFNDGWGFPVLGAIVVALMVVAAGVLLSWGLLLAS
jgi:hypothetical protein